MVLTNRVWSMVWVLAEGSDHVSSSGTPTHPEVCLLSPLPTSLIESYWPLLLSCPLNPGASMSLKMIPDKNSLGV